MMTKRTKIKVIKMRISIDDDLYQGDFNEDPDREVEMTIINLQYEMNAVFFALYRTLQTCLIKRRF